MGPSRAEDPVAVDVQLRDEPIDGPSGTALIDAFEAEIAGLYPGWHRGVGPGASVAELSSPGGGFVVAYLADEAAGCGGFKRLDAQRAELKRMYVPPRARGLGVGRKVLEGIEDRARRAGYTLIRLDTGTAQRAAHALYRSAGYLAIPDYNGNPVADLWFEKPL